MERRFEYPEKSTYCNKVLIGSWVQDRSNAIQPPTEICEYTSTYKQHFPPKYTKIDKNIIWDKILTVEDSSNISKVGKFEHPNYFENFTTIYDLAYNHFPKCYKSYIPRRARQLKEIHVPSEEYLPSFGNLTHYGILEYKKGQWKCDVSCTKRQCTNYTQQFQPPRHEDYPSRFTRSNANKVGNCEKHENLSKRRKSCDPITWTCSP